MAILLLRIIYFFRVQDEKKRDHLRERKVRIEREKNQEQILGGEFPSLANVVGEPGSTVSWKM